MCRTGIALRLRALFALAVACALVAGCGSDEEPSASGTAKSTGDKPLRITYIPKNLGNPYFDTIVKGLQAAGKQANFEVNVVGPAQAGATDQLSFIDAAVQQRVDAIAISPNDPDAVVPSLKRAMDAGIKVIAVNSDMNVEGRQVAILPTDFSALGEFLVELQGSLIDYRGDFAVLSATATAPDQNAWIEGMKKTLSSDSKYKDMKLIDVVYGDDEPDKSFTQAEALMNKYPNLRGITAPTTVGVAAAAKALQGKGKAKAKQLALTGLGTPDQMREFIAEGTVKKFALWDPEKQGLIAGHLLAKMARDDVKPEPNATFDVPEVGTVTITEDTQIITGPPVTFDAANIGDFHF